MNKVKTGTQTKLVSKNAIRVVSLELLQVDASYQRELKRGHKSIVTDFEKEALGVPLIGEREDGSLWIVDGQQRPTALKKLGKKTVRAEIFNSSGPEHEAKVFKLVNFNRIKLNPAEQFQAMLTAGDEIAWAIKEAVEKQGFMIVSSRSGRPTNMSDEARAKYVTCQFTLLKMHNCFGVESITFALKTIKECWPSDPLSTRDRLLLGLGLFWSQHDKIVSLEKLLPRLKTVTPHQLLYSASQGVLGGGNMGHAVAEQIEKVYRRKLTRKT